MKRFFVFVVFAFMYFCTFANQSDSLQVINIEDVSVVSFYRHNSNNVIDNKKN